LFVIAVNVGEQTRMFRRPTLFPCKIVRPGYGRGKRLFSKLSCNRLLRFEEERGGG